MISAFMEGARDAKKGKNIRDNPYCEPSLITVKDKYAKTLWEQGFLHQLEIQTNAS